MARKPSPRPRENAAMTPYGWLALRQLARANGLHDPSMTLAVTGGDIAFAMADDAGRIDLATHPVTALLGHALQTLAADFGRRDDARRMTVAFRLGQRPGMLVIGAGDERPDVPARPTTDGRKPVASKARDATPQALGGPGDGGPTLVAARRAAKGGGRVEDVRYDILEVMPAIGDLPERRVRVGGARLEQGNAIAWIDARQTNRPASSALLPKTRHHANGRTLREALAGIRAAIEDGATRPANERPPRHQGRGELRP